MNDHTRQPQVDLHAIAREVLQENGFEPAFSAAVKDQLQSLEANPPQVKTSDSVRDMTNVFWSSIDNDTSRDLDQLEYAEKLANDTYRVQIAIADVDAFVPKGSPIDLHAGQQTTTLYTGIENFSMLPDELSTGTTSLLEGQDRLAMVTEFIVGQDGNVQSAEFYRAVVRNKAQLAYDSVGPWLENTAEAPPKVAASAELQAQLKLQDTIAQCLRTERYKHGALNIETTETRPVLQQEEIVDIKRQEKNRATELIEDFMIGANGAVARYFEEKKVSSIRRVVKTPKRWDRIVELARKDGEQLPAEPDSKALNELLMKKQKEEPERFPEISLAVLKLMGSGEYVLERPGEPEIGHFGLAVQDYTHSTAPNRRYADLVTQRILKAVLAGGAAPYSDAELAAIATTCTQKEDAARKVERSMAKHIAAVTMSHRIGQSFDGIITGVTPKGTFVRLRKPVVEGLLARGQKGLDVGDLVHVKLIAADVQRGYIDFARN